MLNAFDFMRPNPPKKQHSHRLWRYSKPATRPSFFEKEALYISKKENGEESGIFHIFNENVQYIVSIFIIFWIRHALHYCTMPETYFRAQVAMLEISSNKNLFLIDNSD